MGTKKGDGFMNMRDEVKIFKALADENRLAVLKLLQNGEKCACRLLEALDISQSTLSHHMKLLCDSGIVNYRKKEKWMYYSIAPECRELLHEIIDQYLSAAKCSCCGQEDKNDT